MENFIISARKYRPQTFDTVVGQKSITGTLKNAILNNQVAQAFLFCGPRGIGKTTCARILAKTINCENLSPNAEACDKCPSCISFNENASFNIYGLDGASNNSVDEIRNLVERVRIPPQMGKYKVYIIDEVHMLSASAFNAFLKTLEEPPAYAKFILATTEKHKIIPTILSRCQIFDFKRITVEDIVSHLAFVAEREGIEVDENALHVIAQKADGAMRDALTIFDQLVSFAGNALRYETVLENLNVLDYEYFFTITGQILHGDIPSSLLTINEIIEKGFDGQHFLSGFGDHLRNLLVSKDPVTVQLMETAPSIRNHYLIQAEECPVDFLLKAMDINNRCDLNYKISNNKRLHLELAVMQMCSIRTTGTGTPDEKREIAAPEKQVFHSERKPEITAEQKPVEPVKPKDARSFPKTTSIKTPRQVKDPDKEQPLLASEEDPTYQTSAGFSLEQLEEAWDEYAKTLHVDDPLLFNTLKKYRPVLKDDFMIEFCVDNKVIEEELIRKKGDLLHFLRTKLNNSGITIQTLIPEVPRGTKPYTDREKFASMAEKNPAMNNLRDQLDLSVD
jgi:DNA polymerase-3 subunit gamma/tau